MARITGHGLIREGAAHDDNGDLDTRTWVVNTSGAGRGKCQCGALSEVLPSGNARRAWHKVHKAEVQTGASR